MKRVLVISFSPIATDPRVMRQLRALQGRYAVTVAGFGPAPAGPWEFHDISAAPAPFLAKAAKALMLLSGLHEAYYRRMSYVRNTRRALEGRTFDAVVADDVVALPVALELAGAAPVLLDAHEYTPREFEDLWRWRLFFARFYTGLCRRYLHRAAAMTTVCQGIADEYREAFGIAPPRIVLNCPAPQELPVQPFAPGTIRLVHHGICIPSRQLELMVEMMRHLHGGYTLDLMLVPSNRPYFEHLRALAAGDPRIRFRDPVPMEGIASAINAYDIGVFLLPPVNFNYRHALPNKFFEFVQARLAVAIGPSPEMARLVHEHGFGVVAGSFDAADLAARIRELEPADILRMKQRADAASRVLNAEQASAVFLAEVERIMA